MMHYMIPNLVDVKQYHINILFSGVLLYCLTYCYSRTYGIDVKDFGPSWRDGHAFNAIIHNINPELVDMAQVPRNPNRVNLENAFSTAENHLGIPRLLDPEGGFNFQCWNFYSALTRKGKV